MMGNVTNKHVKGPLNPSLSYHDMSEEQLKSLWDSYYPSGSGPLGMMMTVCGLIENIAHLRGINVSNWVKS
jgi:hypothetical protein